jgi:translation initiation factor eIF-2B subunit gamma
MLPNSLLPTLLPKPQFRAVILCGYGVDLFPLVEPPIPSTSTSTTTTHGHHGQTKALLPVAGKKMIDWVLQLCLDSGILDVIVLTPESLSKNLNSHLRSSSFYSGSGSGLKIELEEIPTEIAQKGTVRVLMWATLSKLIKSDFILLPCDLLLSPSSSSSNSISLASLLDRHRTDDNLVTSLFSTRSSGNVRPSGEKHQGPVELLTLYDRQSDRLLDLKELDELQDQDEIPIRTSLLTKYPKLCLTKNLLPTQLYIFSNLLLPLLSITTDDQNDQDQDSDDVLLLRRLKSFESVKELVGWIARSNWRKKGKFDLANSSSSSSKRGELAMGRSTTQSPPTNSNSNSSRQQVRSTSQPQTPGTTTPTPALISRNSWLDTRHHHHHHYDHENILTHDNVVNRSSSSSSSSRAGAGGCKIIIWNEQNGFCARGNTVPGWVEINRAVSVKLSPPLSLLSSLSSLTLTLLCRKNRL